MADEKYTLTLEGSEIDEALLRLANYEDEGLVLGSRKGVMLGPGSEYYHKNARYYAELAQSAVPGDTTSAVRWDIDQSALTDENKAQARENIDAVGDDTAVQVVAQTFTPEQQAIARANIAAGGTNPNLLDNPFFTVNQRSANGTITNGQYGVDRWMAGGGTVTMATGGITLGAGNSYALQRPANKEIFNGKTVTMSVMTDDGIIESGTVVAQTGVAKAIRTANFELCIGYTAYGSFYFYNTSASAKTVIAVKLELGSTSTLANDLPPDYGTELAKCQRYFLRVTVPSTAGQPFCVGYTASSTQCRIFIPTPVSMRTVTTVSYTGTIYIYPDVKTVSSMSMGSTTPNGVIVFMGVSSITTGVPCIAMGANFTIDLSAEL